MIGLEIINTYPILKTKLYHLERDKVQIRQV